jgi:hypothetical protein
MEVEPDPCIRVLTSIYIAPLHIWEVPSDIFRVLRIAPHIGKMEAHRNYIIGTNEPGPACVCTSVSIRTSQYGSGAVLSIIKVVSTHFVRVRQFLVLPGPLFLLTIALWIFS